MKKRILAIVLSLCMMITLSPIFASAAEENPCICNPVVESNGIHTNPDCQFYANRNRLNQIDNEITTAEELKTALETGGNVTLTQNIEIADNNWCANISKEVTLDLNGCTITKTGGVENGYLIKISNEGKLILEDSSDSANGAIMAKDKSYGYGIQLQSNSAFIMNGGRIETTQESVDIYFGSENVTVQINDGNIHSSSDGALFVRGSNHIDVDINNGSLSSDYSNNCIFIRGEKAGAVSVDITGGTIIGPENNYVVYSYQYGDVTIGGTAVIQAERSNAIYAKDNTNLDITGGTISTTSSYAAAVKVDNHTNCNISGGKITGGGNNKKAFESGSSYQGETIITGGTFSSDISAYVPEDMNIVPDADGNLVVIKPNAVWGEEENVYENSGTLEEAIKSLAQGQTMYIKLTDDVQLTDKISTSLGSHVILDLAGYTITAAEGKSILLIAPSSILTLNDNSDEKSGRLTGANINDHSNGAGVTVQGEGTFIMNGGAITGNKNDGQGAGGVHLHRNATFIMNGGAITNNKANYLQGGVYAGQGVKSVTISGDVNITGNKGVDTFNGAKEIDSNLWLNTLNNVLLSIGETGLSENAKIGISVNSANFSNDLAFTLPYVSGKASINNFLSDRQKLSIKEIDNGEQKQMALTYPQARCV